LINPHLLCTRKGQAAFLNAKAQELRTWPRKPMASVRLGTRRCWICGAVVHLGISERPESFLQARQPPDIPGGCFFLDCKVYTLSTTCREDTASSRNIDQRWSFRTGILLLSLQRVRPRVMVTRAVIEVPIPRTVLGLIPKTLNMV
jgi:hypothetical protein